MGKTHFWFSSLSGMIFVFKFYSQWGCRDAMHKGSGGGGCVVSRLERARREEEKTYVRPQAAYVVQRTVDRQQLMPIANCCRSTTTVLLVLLSESVQLPCFRKSCNKQAKPLKKTKAAKHLWSPSSSRQKPSLEDYYQSSSSSIIFEVIAAVTRTLANVIIQQRLLSVL